MLHAHFLPSLVTPQQLAGGAVVVIDVLRASTTIVYSLAAGAKEVIPCLDVAEARRVAANLPAGTKVLAGERGCLKVEGFDLGNSPLEHTPEAVAGKTVVISTTNGTRALDVCRQAAHVFIGAFANLAAIVGRLRAETSVHLLCAGCEGQPTREDVLFAGAVVHALQPTDHTDLNDSAQMARAVWMAAQGPDLTDEQLFRELMNSQGAVNLARVGYERDIRAAAQTNDKRNTLPTLDLKAWRITL